MTEHKSLAEALAAFQAEVPKVRKGEEANAGSYKYKYADLADVVDEVKECMGKHGLSFSGYPCFGPDGKPALRYVLRHSSGDSESEVMPLMLSRGDAQSHGSAITYARRYAFQGALNIVADADDDGRAATDAARHVSTNAQPPSVDFRRAATGLTGGQIRDAFRACGLTPPGAEVPTWQLFQDVPAAKAPILAEALAAVGR